MNSRAGIHKIMSMGKEAKFVLLASVVLLSAMLLPLTEVYWYGVALSVSAVVAMVMALYEVRLWVRLLAILILPWINTLIGSGPKDPNEDPLFVVPDYLPFVNEMPELLLASVVQLGVFVAAVRHGRCRQERVTEALV